MRSRGTGKGERVRRAWLVTAFFLLLPAGCGDAPEPDAESLAENASTALQDRQTLRFAMRAEESEPPMRCRGAVDYERHRVNMTCDLGGDGDFELITIGRDEYSRGSFLELEPDDEEARSKPWEKTSGGKATVTDFPDLRVVLTELRRAAISSERLGRERVRDVETTRYRVVVDPAKTEFAEAEGDPKTATLELWIDDDDLLRRVSGREGGSPFVAEFFAFGEPVVIEPPPVDQVREGPELGGNLCEGGETAPLRQAQVVEALRHNGIDVAPHPAGCLIDPEAVVGLSTELAAAAEDDLGDGLVTCGLRRTGGGSARGAIKEERRDGAVTLELANVSCALLSEDREGPDLLPDLRSAFEELRRSLD